MIQIYFNYFKFNQFQHFKHISTYFNEQFQHNSSFNIFQQLCLSILENTFISNYFKFYIHFKLFHLWFFPFNTFHIFQHIYFNHISSYLNTSTLQPISTIFHQYLHIYASKPSYLTLISTLF